MRPDSLRLASPGTDGCIEGEVELCTWLGSVVEHAVRIAPDITMLARGPGLGRDATPRHSAGTRVALRWEAEDERLFDAGGSRDATATGHHQGDQSCVNLTLSRRGVLGGAALLAAPAIIRPARAAEQCVVGTWGGDYARLLRENIDDPILKPAGINVVQDVGDETPRMAKLYAQTKLPRGTQDIACLRRVERLSRQRCRPGRGPDRAAGAEPEARAAGAADARLRAAHLQRAGAGVQPGQRSRTRRSSFGDLLDPKWKGKIGMVSTVAPWVMMGASLFETGTRPISTRPRSSC